MTEQSPIEQTVQTWHRYLAGDPDLLDELLADDVVFYSPVVFTPQRGKAITTLYLRGAAQVLNGGEGEAAFHYVKQVVAGDTAVLEFETTLDGKYVDGVDIIRCGPDGRIVEFRVMVRPLQAITALHAAMGAMLERLKG